MKPVFDLDHVAVIVRDLNQAERSFSRLGFQLTKRSSHKGPIPGSGKVAPWGSGNHCAMFRQGYLELLGVTDPTRHKAHIDARLARYEGVHLIAFGSSDAAADAAALRAQGVEISAPRELGRDIPYGQGSKPGRFAISYLDEERYPEADFIVIEQQTREYLWQPELLDHPNGAISLDSVTVCPLDAAEFFERMAPILGPASSGGFELRPGRLEVATPGDLPQLFAGLAAPEAPRSVAVRLGVAELALTRTWLARQRVPLLSDERYLLRVGPEQCCGAVIEFAEVDRDGSKS